MNRRDFLAGMCSAAGLLYAGHAPATLIPTIADPVGKPCGDTGLAEIELDRGVNRRTGLFPDCTFDRFIEGRANRHARTVAFIFDSNPYSIQHPLCIYGAVGLGKTHLMQSIGHKILDQNSHARVRYVHAEDFHEHLQQARKGMALDGFRNTYDSLDVLLLDDIQCFNRHPGTQIELLRTLDKLTERGSLIVVTAGSLLKERAHEPEMAAMNPYLMSRIHGGQPVELYRPDFELRMNCLIAKAQEDGLDLSNDVVRYVAKRLRSRNMRVLEGTLNRIVAFSRFHGKDLSLAVARQALSGSV